MVEEGQIGVIGAMYNVGTGEVAFYDDTKIIEASKELAAETL